MRKSTVVPSTVEEMFTEYFQGNDSFVNSCVRKMLPYSSQDDREDVVSDILLRSIEHDIIAKYDDKITKDFAGIIFTVIRSVVANKCRKTSQTGVMASLVETVEEFSKGTYALDSNFAVNPDANLMLNDSRLMALYRYANERVKANECVRDRSLRPMLDLMLQGYEHSEIAARLNVRPSTVSGWVSYIQDAATV
jgi:DNA-directed RNA polymerase specialized sigma24 family protein